MMSFKNDYSAPRARLENTLARQQLARHFQSRFLFAPLLCEGDVDKNTTGMQKEANAANVRRTTEDIFRDGMKKYIMFFCCLKIHGKRFVPTPQRHS
jgi:hypothetical protein